jgi:hypothetical protein
MTNRIAMGVTAVVVLTFAVGTAGESLKSGPAVGEAVYSQELGRGPFHPLNCTGASAGKKNCLVWQNGLNPVAMIFAREVSDSLTSLVKKIDAETAKNSKANMGSFVVFLADDEKLSDKLESLAKKEGIKKCVFAIDNPAGPKGYNVAKEADVTVVLYNKRKVVANYAFKKGDLNDAAITIIMADVPKILDSPKKETK